MLRRVTTNRVMRPALRLGPALRFGAETHRRNHRCDLDPALRLDPGSPDVRRLDGAPRGIRPRGRNQGIRAPFDAGGWCLEGSVSFVPQHAVA